MGKIIFANQLRGLAAIFVAASHLVGVFWAMRDFVGLASASPVQATAPPIILALFTQPWLNFGPLGVGVFFLISGLVIPISLEQHSRASFILARLLRIYPTYLVALLLEMAVLHASAAYWNKIFPYGNWAIISNALLIYNTVGQPSIDLVNWTLCVELKFYLLMMLLASQVRRGSVLTILFIGFAALCANTAIARYQFAVDGMLRELLQQSTAESTFIIFMLIGVLFNFHLRGLVGLPAFAASCFGMLGLFLASWTQSAISEQFPIVPLSYLYALILFGVLYATRARARPIRVLDFIADISFPFYLIHSLIGYALLKVLMLRLGWSYTPAGCVTVAVLVGLATALHLAVETRSIAIGRMLARQRRRSAPASLARQKITAT